MKIERIPEHILSMVVVLMGLIFAVYCGKMAGTGNLKTVGTIFAVLACAAVGMGFRDRIWILIPLCWPLTGKIPITEWPFTVRDVAVLLTFGSFLIFSTLKLLRYKPKFELLDFFIGLNLFNLLTVFIRNPVGVDWLNSELVGGRPYFDIFIAYLAFWVLSRSPITTSTLRGLPILVLFGTALIAVGGVAIAIHPAVGDHLGQFYSAFAATENSNLAGEEEIGRMTILAFGGLASALVLASCYSPVSLFSLRHPLRLLAMAAAILAILLSGFRSFLFAAFVYIALSCYFRNRWRDVTLLAGVGAVLIAIVVLGNNRLFHLPLSAQRALSFLPGDWDYAATSDAKGSTDWRYEIWKMALFEEGWIQNKWLGDGFGFTKHQLNIMRSQAGYIGGAGGQEAFLVVGNYHSGPISTIRYAGGVGLILFVPFMGMMVMRCLRLIKESRGTPYFTLALIIGLPIIYLPFPWVFVAGSFDNGLIDLIYAAGFVKLLERGLADYRSKNVEAAVENEFYDEETRRLSGGVARPSPAYQP